ITEVAETTHSWSPMPALIFGGRALGIQGGQYIELPGGPGARGYNAMWMSVAQAYLGADPLAALSHEVFDKSRAEPIPGVWAPPARSQGVALAAHVPGAGARARRDRCFQPARAWPRGSRTGRFGALGWCTVSKYHLAATLPVCLCEGSGRQWHEPWVLRSRR